MTKISEMSSKEVEMKVQDKMFTKGFMQGKSNNKKPDYFANIARNIRIRNGGLTVRDGFVQLYEGDLDEVQGICGSNSELLYVHDDKLKKIDLTDNTVSIIQALDTAGGKVSFINYGIYTIILTGVDYPWVYDGSSCVQLTDANIAASVNPSFGVRYAGFTVVNSAIGAKNVMRISRPITLAAQDNSYMRDLTAGSESITYDSEILGFESSTNYLWVFTENTIEKMTKDNLTTTGGVQSLFTLPIAKGQQVLNNDSIVSAGDSVFFMTANMQFASLEYEATNQTDPTLTVLSDRWMDGLDIQEWLKNLNEDQSKSFMIFDKKQNCVKWFCRSFVSTVNDSCLVFDITNRTFYEDDNKYYSCICEFKNKYYSGGAFNGDLYQDEVGKLDGVDGIDRKYSVDMIVGTKFRKKWVGSGLSGAINYSGKILWEIEIEGILEFKDYINGLDYNENDSDLGIGGAMLGERPTGGEIASPYSDINSFDVRITDSRLSGKGETMTMIFSGSEPEQDFLLDYLDISYKPLRTIEKSKKF